MSKQLTIVNGIYKLYSSTSRSLQIVIEDQSLTFSGRDYGAVCEMMTGKDEYEFHYVLDEENTYNLVSKIKEKYDENCNLNDILKKEFGYEDGSVRFKEFCERMKIEYKFYAV